MTFQLFDSLSRQIQVFQPLRAGEVSIYCCGPTVQSDPHLGHVRKEVNFDVLRRWLEHEGYQVTMVTNVTDIDDKILEKAAAAGREWWAHAYRYEKSFHAAFRALGVRPPTYEPRATGHIPEMVELISELIATGHAYPAADGSGDVYFDVSSWASYGELTGMKAEEMAADAEADTRGKRNPRDFALWKGHKPGEPDSASWNTPWGRGRPGWHLECSAMAGKYLGEEFDIHGGGLDLRFPHHENELAQSRAAGRRFARYWMHNAWVTLSGEKMSKSLGNTADVHAAVTAYGGRAVRLYLAGPHYRSQIELSDASLGEAAAQLARIDSFLERAQRLAGEVAPSSVPAAFAKAMNDDLGTPGAMAVLFTTIKDGNIALDAGDLPSVATTLGQVRAMLGILGLDPSAPEWAGSHPTSDLSPVVDALVGALLEQRTQARARKDWAGADAIRDDLARIGLKVEDTASGPRWTLETNRGTDAG